MSMFKSLVLAAVLLSSFQSAGQSCPSGGTARSYANRSPVVYSQPRYAAPTQQPAQRQAGRTFIVCTQDNSGQWWVRQVTESQQAAQQLKARFQANGQRAWAMEAFPVPKAQTFTFANGEVAIALAISIGEDAHAVAIGPSGRAEALARQ